MVLNYLAGALVPSRRHVDDEIDEERVGDEVQVEEEPMPLCQLISRKKWFHEKLIVTHLEEGVKHLNWFIDFQCGWSLSLWLAGNVTSSVKEDAR